MGKNRKMSFNGRKLARNEQMDRRVMLMVIFLARGGGLSSPAPGYIHVYDQNIQTFSFSKTVWQIKAKLYVKHPQEE